MRAQRYEVEFHDGRVEIVTVSGADYLFYEETSGESALDLITEARKMGTWYTAAYAAMVRQGMYEGSAEEFKEAVSFILPTGDGNPSRSDSQKEGSGN